MYAKLPKSSTSTLLHLKERLNYQRTFRSRPCLDSTMLSSGLAERSNPKWDMIPVIFPPQRMHDGTSRKGKCLILVLAEWLSKKQIPQCHIAETEKYAHVTFFFNGGVEKQYPLEDREMIPSPKVATYDLEPYLLFLYLDSKEENERAWRSREDCGNARIWKISVRHFEPCESRYGSMQCNHG